MKYESVTAAWTEKEQLRFKPRNLPAPSLKVANTKIIAFLLALLFAVSCKNPSQKNTSKSANAAGQNLPLATQPLSTTEERRGDEILRRLSSCQIWHGGLVLDLGDPASGYRDNFQLKTGDDEEFIQRQGVQLRQLSKMRTSFHFWLPQDLPKTRLSAMMRGIDDQGRPGSSRVAFYLDGKRLGASKLAKKELQLLRLKTNQETLRRGRHELMVSISRPEHGPPAAQIAWARIGSAEDARVGMPPAFSELKQDLAIGKEHEEALILRSNTVLRCPTFVSQGSRLSTKIGIWGQGGGRFVANVLDAQGQRHALNETEIDEDEKPKWYPLQLDLTPFVGQLVQIELHAESIAEGARLALANPRFNDVHQLPQPRNETAAVVKNDKDTPARRAIVILLSGLGREHFPPAAAVNGLPLFNELSQDALSFRGYQTDTTAVSGVIASLLTGLPAWQHGVEGPQDTLSTTFPTIAEDLEAQSGRAAFFTSVPLSFRSVGFSRGFEVFNEYSPAADISALQPIIDAQHWLSQHQNDPRHQLALLHLRGGHPPFDIPKKEEENLPPAEYGGNLTARRAAIQLSEIRNRQNRRRRKMPEEDWIREEALRKAALITQDKALREFLDQLKTLGLYRQSMIIIMGDVGAGEKPHLPFSTRAPLSAEYLKVPLFIKPAESSSTPQPHRASTLHTLQEAPFQPIDLATTLRQYFDLPARDSHQGYGLLAQDSWRSVIARPALAYRNQNWQAQIGTYLLTGQNGKSPKFYDLTLDPTLLYDRSDESPLTTRALWAMAWQQLAPALAKGRRRKTTEKIQRSKTPLEDFQPSDGRLDPTTAAQIVWGIPQ
ncbi:MAG: sulfatase-like hydrolase/transferase [Polyangiaceae bacterium]|nr:sulfatase-like hydrolase/transferase [Polyangiaceae bacterium]